MRGTALKAFDRSEVKLADQLEKDIQNMMAEPRQSVKYGEVYPDPQGW